LPEIRKSRNLEDYPERARRRISLSRNNLGFRHPKASDREAVLNISLTARGKESIPDLGHHTAGKHRERHQQIKLKPGVAAA